MPDETLHNEIPGSHAAPVQSTSGEGFDLRDFRSALGTFATGGGAIYERNPIQRAFRDVHAANAHYVLNWDVNGAVYGRVALGLPPDAPL